MQYSSKCLDILGDSDSKISWELEGRGGWGGGEVWEGRLNKSRKAVFAKEVFLAGGNLGVKLNSKSGSN